MTAPPAERARIEARVRSLAGDGDVELTLKTLVLVLDRAQLTDGSSGIRATSS